MVREEGGWLSTLVPAGLGDVGSDSDTGMQSNREVEAEVEVELELVVKVEVELEVEDSLVRCGGGGYACGTSPAGGWVVGEEGGWLATLAPAGLAGTVERTGFCFRRVFRECSDCTRSLLRLMAQNEELQYACSWNICSKGASIIVLTSSSVLCLFCEIKELQLIFMRNASKFVHSVSDRFFFASS